MKKTTGIGLGAIMVKAIMLDESGSISQQKKVKTVEKNQKFWRHKIKRLPENWKSIVRVSASGLCALGLPKRATHTSPLFHGQVRRKLKSESQNSPTWRAPLELHTLLYQKPNDHERNRGVSSQVF